MPLPFHKSLDLKLINFVKGHPALYDTTNELYLRTDIREDIWKEIGEALDRPAILCKSRWINIRDNLRRNVRERMNKTKYHKYKYENDLSFILPFIHIQPQTLVEENCTQNSDEDNEVSESPKDVLADGQEDMEESHDVKPDISTAVNRGEEEICTQRDRVTFETISREVQCLQPVGDPINVFLEAVGSTLRKLSPYFLNQAKSKIFQVAQDYELQELITNGEKPSTSEHSST